MKKPRIKLKLVQPTVQNFPTPPEGIEPFETLGEFIARVKRVERPPDLVRGLIPGMGWVTWHGSYRTLKSWLLLHLIICIAMGRKLLGRFNVVQGRVGLILEEDPDFIVWERLAALCKGLDIDVEEVQQRIDIRVRRGSNLDDEEFLAYVRKTALKRQWLLLAVDPIRNVSQKVDQGPKDWQELRRVVHDIQNAVRTEQSREMVFAMIHHDRKLRGDRERKQRTGEVAAFEADGSAASGGGVIASSDAPVQFQGGPSHRRTVDAPPGEDGEWVEMEAESVVVPYAYKYGYSHDKFRIRVRSLMQHSDDSDPRLDTAWVELVDVGTAVFTKAQDAIAKAIRLYFRTHGRSVPASGSDIAKAIKKDAADTRMVLRALVEKRVLKRSGKKKSTQYTVATTQAGTAWLAKNGKNGKKS